MGEEMRRFCVGTPPISISDVITGSYGKYGGGDAQVRSCQRAEKSTRWGDKGMGRWGERRQDASALEHYGT